MNADSSTENEQPTEPVVPPEQKNEAKVPVAVVAKQRAETRAARAEADDLKRQLAEAKEQNPQLDIQQLMDAISATIDQRTEEAFSKAVAPLKAEVEQRKTAMTLGLTEPQTTALFDMKAKAPGLTDQQLLTVLRAERKDLFKEAPRPTLQLRSLPTSVPAGAESPMRSAPAPTDHMELSRQARQAALKGEPGAGKAMQEHAEVSYFEAINRARLKKNGG